MTSYLRCPGCGSRVKYHGRYRKRFYDKKILIIRVRCLSKDCRTTHALIPSFSVPCCSTGMKEMDQFITMRKNGATVSEAGQCFVDAGMSPDYPDFIHKRFKRVVTRLSAIFESLPFQPAAYEQYIFSLCQLQSTQPVTEINQSCYPRGYNPVCFSRCNILLLPKFNAKPNLSHNPPSRPPP